MKKTFFIAALAVSIVHSGFAVTASREWTLTNFYTKGQIDDNVGPRIQTVEQTVGQLGQRVETIGSELAVATGRVLAVESAVSSRRSVADLAVYTNAFSWNASGQGGQAVKSLLDSNRISPVWDEQRSRWTIPAKVGEYTVDWERLTGDESVTNRAAERIVFHPGGEIDVGYEDETGYHGSFYIESLVAEVDPVKSDDTILRKSEADGRFVPNGQFNVSSDWMPMWNREPLFYWDIGDSWYINPNRMKINWRGVHGTPTTLSGYGITDAYQVMSSAFSNDVVSVVTSVVYTAETHYEYVSVDLVTVGERTYYFKFNGYYDPYYHWSLYDQGTGVNVGYAQLEPRDVAVGAFVIGSDFENGVYDIISPINLVVGEHKPESDERFAPAIVLTNDLDVAVRGLSNAVLNADNVAIGLDSSSAGSSSGLGTSTAVGRMSIASADSATAFGYDAQATAEHAAAFGPSAHAFAPHSTALGRNSDVTANGTNSISIGWGSYVNKTNSIAIGHLAKATGPNSVQIGSGVNGYSNSLKFRETIVVNGKGKIPSASLEHSVSGVSFDFKSGENAVKTVYDQLTNVIIRLGGKVVNPIPFN